MTNTTPAEEMLKTDVLGRVNTPRARQEALIDEFERTGVSGQKFRDAGGHQLPDVCGVSATKASARTVGEPLRVSLPGGGWGFGRNVAPADPVV